MKVVLTLVHLPEVLDAGPDALLGVLGVLRPATEDDPGDAVDVRLDGGAGPVNQQPLSDLHWRAWRDLTTHYLGGPARPTYAGLVYTIARHYGLEVRGHGWVAARHLDEAAAAGRRVAGYCRRYRLARYGCNGESGVWRGRQVGWKRRPGTRGPDDEGLPLYEQRPDAEALLHAWLSAVYDGQDYAAVDWMGYDDPGVHYANGAPVSWGLRRRFGRAIMMTYQHLLASLRAAAQDALAAWFEHAARGDVGLLTGSGRWHDADGDGVVDAGEVVGDPDAIRTVLAETGVAEWHPYVGFGAASQLAQGHRLFPPLISYIPQLREALA